MELPQTLTLIPKDSLTPAGTYESARCDWIVVEVAPSREGVPRTGRYDVQASEWGARGVNRT
jgi:hypothetical protein